VQRPEHLLNLTAAIQRFQAVTGKNLFVVPNLNNQEFRNSLKAKSFIDARDSSEMWWAAEVLEVDSSGRYVVISYEGWPPRSNERIPIDSERLAPLFSQTSNERRFQDPQQEPNYISWTPSSKGAGSPKA
jgi:hypothetical protein